MAIVVPSTATASLAVAIAVGAVANDRMMRTMEHHLSAGWKLVSDYSSFFSFKQGKALPFSVATKIV